jgi:nucleoid-associated protein YgaU
MFFAATAAKAQDAAEAARQEKARKAAQTQKQQPHVYTNDDLQRSQILTPEDRGTVEARKNKAEPPAVKLDSPSNAGVEDAAAPKSLGEIARRLRQEKAVRQAEQAGKLPPPSPYKIELPTPTTLAHPKPMSGPLVAPTLLVPKKVRPSGATGSMKRDPFSRAAIPAAPGISITAPVLTPVIPRAPSPGESPTVAATPTMQPILPRNSGVEKDARPDSIRVQAGDSLWSLSRQILGKGSLWQEWLSRNPHVGDPRRLQPGMTLLVPVAAAVAVPTANAPANVALGAKSQGTVSVQSGDSLWRIAVKHYGRGASWSCLAQANPAVQNVDRIYPGQILAVPGACGSAEATPVSPVVQTLPTN